MDLGIDSSVSGSFSLSFPFEEEGNKKKASFFGSGFAKQHQEREEAINEGFKMLPRNNTNNNNNILHSFHASSPAPPSSGGGYYCVRGPFTASQWMELEHQALIYKYINANVPIPSYLLDPIRKPFQSAAFRSTPFGWGGFQLGFSNSDPEPGRCRRTDGKKWRCSRDAVADQKYCERHMNRGRHRSRKPVEQQSGHAASSSNKLPPVGGSSAVAAAAARNGNNNNLAAGSEILGLSTFVDRNVEGRQKHHHQNPCSSSSEFGSVCSDSLLNPHSFNANRTTPHHLSISIPHLEKTPSSLSWIPISWESSSSIAGPLGEVLHGKPPLNLMVAASSPTGVLQRSSLAGSLSNSSAGSSPTRAENSNGIGVAAMNHHHPSLPLHLSN